MLEEYLNGQIARVEEIKPEEVTTQYIAKRSREMYIEPVDELEGIIDELLERI